MFQQMAEYEFSQNTHLINITSCLSTNHRLYLRIAHKCRPNNFRLESGRARSRENQLFSGQDQLHYDKKYIICFTYFFTQLLKMMAAKNTILPRLIFIVQQTTNVLVVISVQLLLLNCALIIVLRTFLLLLKTVKNILRTLNSYYEMMLANRQ